MAREQTIELLKLLETDEALLEQVRDKKPDEVAEIARGLSFDITGDDLEAAIAEIKAERARQQTPEEVPVDQLDRVAGGAFWDGETAPDGHEMGCVIPWHGNEWQEKNKVYCHKMNLCNKYFHVCLSQPNRSHDPYMDS